MAVTVAVMVPLAVAVAPAASLGLPSVTLPSAAPELDVQVPLPPSLPSISAGEGQSGSEESVTGKPPIVSVQSPPVPVEVPPPQLPSVGVSSGTVEPPSAPSVSSDNQSGQGTVGPSSPHESAPAAAASGAGAGGGAAAANGVVDVPIGVDAGPSVGSGKLLTPKAGAGVRARIARRERTLKATVARLAGCLGEVPPRQRKLLELRSGLGGEDPLDPRAAAAKLHVSLGRLVGWERRAVRELRAQASADGCRRAHDGIAALAGSTLGRLIDEHPLDGGGTREASYRQRASSAGGVRAPLSHARGSLLGLGLSSEASNAVLILLLLLAACVTLLVVLGDEAGQGPRHASWRRRIGNRLNARR